MEFAVKTAYDRRDTCALVRAYAWLKTYERPLGKLPAGPCRSGGGFGGVCGCADAVLSGRYADGDRWGTGNVSGGGGFAGSGTDRARHPDGAGLARQVAECRIAWNGYREKETRIVYTLTPEQFYERLPASGHRLEYTLITAVLEDRERFFLVMGTQAHILKKSDFVKGDPENFRRFICEVTGKTVKFVT